MNLQRLKFAWARGARVQSLFFETTWQTSKNWDISGIPYRIHPDDEHLQYGPLSTALREWADQPFGWLDRSPRGNLCVEAETLAFRLLGFPVIDPGDRGLMRGFMAEMLADEGL